jgi:dihydroorotase
VRYTLLIKNGTVVDPGRGVMGRSDVVVLGQRIVDAGQGNQPIEADQVIDAEGCLVVPGLIDFHAHLFSGGTEIGIEPDLGLLPQGVTTAVDAGSAGVANFEGFAASVISRSVVRIKAYLNVCPVGLVSIRYSENVDPRHYDAERTAELLAKHRGSLLGLKVRQSRAIVGDLGLAPLKASLKIAGDLHCPVVVHTTDAPAGMDEIAGLLRPGDVFCHVFHGTGNTILDGSGKILPGMAEARRRGVLFDVARGRTHFVYPVAQAALGQGFPPDVIGTDITCMAIYRMPLFGLPRVMSEWISLGMPLPEVVTACTATPARLLGMEGEIGTLRPGACADIAVFKQQERSETFVDAQGTAFKGKTLLVPQLTVRAGTVVFRYAGF